MKNPNQELMRYRGTLLKERYADEIVVKALELSKTSDWKVKDASKELKIRWTVISFEVESADADDIAHIFVSTVRRPDWFLRLESDDGMVMIFPQKVFKFPKGDVKARTEAVEYARSIKLPELLSAWVG
jgi:hypothetical protein